MVLSCWQDDAKDKEQESEEVQLRIAWQYRRYIKSKQRAAADTRFAPALRPLIH